MINFWALSLFVQSAGPQLSLGFRQFVTSELFLPHHLLSRVNFCKLQLSLTLNLLLYLQLGLSLSFFLLIAPLDNVKFFLLFKSHFLESFKLKFSIINLHLLDPFSFLFGLLKKYLPLLFFFLHFALPLHLKPQFFLLEPLKLLQFETSLSFGHFLAFCFVSCL